MPSVKDRTRNNVALGLWVIISIAVLFVVVAVLSDAMELLQARKSYTVRFTVAAGVDGLSPGSEVRVGGLKRGAVIDVRPLSDEEPMQWILVEFDLDDDITLYKNAQALRISPLLGNVAAINFASVGDPSVGELASGDTLDAITAAGMLATFAGPEIAANAEAIITNLKELTAQLEQDYSDNISPALAHASGMVDQVEEVINRVDDVVTSVQSDYSDWDRSFESILSSVQNITDSANLGLDDARQVIATVQMSIDENSPKVNVILDNVQDTTATAKEFADHFNTVSRAKIDGMLDTGTETLDTVQAAVAEVAEIVAVSGPDLIETTSNIRLAAQQLKLTMIEVRRAPWMIAYTPSPEEQENELLFQALESFAVAAMDLQATSKTMDNLAERHRDLFERDPELLESMIEAVAESFGKYQDAQEKLMGVLKDNQP